MRKYIQLSIPEPCHEDWDKMTTVDKGKFCGACQKNVIDFTTMSDEQLVALFKKPTSGSTCGRFMGEQLDRNMTIPGKRIPWVKYFFQIALPAFLVSSKISAQGKVRMLTGDTTVVTDQKTYVTENIKPLAGGRRIEGKIIDENGVGVPYASVFIRGTTIGNAADSSGSFSLEYLGKENCIVLISSCVGFQSSETEIDLNNMKNITIISMAYNIAGEVVVAGFVQRKGRVVTGAMSRVTINFFDTISKIFCSKPALNLYPNPIHENNSLTIEMVKHEKGTYSVQLAALNGQIVLNKEVWMGKNDRVIKIDIPSVAAGIYLVSMINKQSGKNNTEKIIIE